MPNDQWDPSELADVAWYDDLSRVETIRGRIILLNRARKWLWLRKIAAYFGYVEADSLQCHDRRDRR